MTLEGLIEGRYSVIEELGRGAMGVVHRAKDVDLGREVAVKVVAPELMRDPGAFEALQREARALASVKSDSVVQIYVFGRHSDTCYFSMELVRGVGLDTVIEDHKARGTFVPVRRARTLVARIAAGLDAVHAAGIVHRDVKPNNIVIEEGTGRPVLLDFGLAVRPQATDPSISAGGTPHYSSPEQLIGAVDELTPQSDVYSFACTAFELFTGIPPFDQATTFVDLVSMHVRTPAPLLSSLRKDLAELDPIFAKALAKAPADRYRSCGDMAKDMEDAFGSEDLAWLWGAKPVSQQFNRPKPAAQDTFEILVVDDDPLFAKFAARAASVAFHGVPCNITVAENGRVAVNRAEQRAPRLVFLDFDMPELDGVETLSMLRARPGGDTAQVLVMSATAGEEERWRFGALGVRDFLSKPVQFPKLVAKLDEMAKRGNWPRAAVHTRGSTR